MELTLSEQLPVLGILGVVIHILYKAFRNKKDYITFWSPMTFLSIISIYYFIVGPLVALSQGKTYFKLVEHRDFFYGAWLASFLMLLFIYFGYLTASRPFRFRVNNMKNEGALSKLLVRIYIIVLLLFSVYTGSSFFLYLNPFADNIVELGYAGAFANYLILSINILIPVIGLATILWKRGRFKFGWLVVFTLFASFIYMSFGFRYRLVILFVSTACCYFISIKSRPSLPTLIIALTLGISLMGFLGITRNYFSGLTLSRAEGSSATDVFFAGFEESKIFMTSGMIINRLPNDKNDYIHLDPVIEAIAIPIPRVLWPGKPSGDHIFYVYELYNPRNPGISTGAAWLLYGEFYLMFGWIGIILGSFFLGRILKKLFLWMKLNVDNPFAVVIYSTSLGTLYFIISRGYLPQHVMLFFFTIFPGYLISRAK